MDRRVVTAAVGLAGSLLLSVLAWVYLDIPFLFFFVPFVPFLFRRGRDSDRQEPAVRSCPVCEFETADPEFGYCPRDGHRLER
jgi:hypothetical protein